MDDKWQKEAWEGQRIEETEAKRKADEEWYEGERKAKAGHPLTEPVPVVLCACGKPVEKESLQRDQCVACYNRK